MLIRAMQKSDYEAVYKLWCEIKGFGIRSIDDSKENIENFLDRNPNLS
ncbi:GNAT family N-acetyltransferase, partial [Campylobacter jejuni]|nr:GNAT family N-acetyltransferase [Campylobacter jejuni]